MFFLFVWSCFEFSLVVEKFGLTLESCASETQGGSVGSQSTYKVGRIQRLEVVSLQTAVIELARHQFGRCAISISSLSL